MIRLMRKTDFCLCENKRHRSAVTAQLISAFGFTKTDSTIPLLVKYEISSSWLPSLNVQARLCWNGSENTKTGFRVAANNMIYGNIAKLLRLLKQFN